MNDIRCLIDDLQDTDEIASRLEGELQQRPNDEILMINAEAIRRRRSTLVERLDYELATQQHDLVLYKIMRHAAGYPASAVAKSILAFQELVTAIFDAIRTMPKLRYRPTIENVALSAMDFAAAHSGSVAVSLSIPNERLILIDSYMDQTFAKVFQLLSAREENDFRQLVEAIGVASIAKAYSWADVSSSFALDTTISWGKELDNLRRLYVSKDEALKIKEAIETTKKEDDEPVQDVCLLEGLDPSTSYFHIRLSDGQDIRGETSDEFPNSEWILNRYYKANLIRRTVLKFATGEEKISWVLESLIETEKSA